MYSLVCIPYVFESIWFHFYILHSKLLDLLPQVKIDVLITKQRSKLDFCISVYYLEIKSEPKDISWWIYSLKSTDSSFTKGSFFVLSKIFDVTKSCYRIYSLTSLPSRGVSLSDTSITKTFSIKMLEYIFNLFLINKALLC